MYYLFFFLLLVFNSCKAEMPSLDLSDIEQKTVKVLSGPPPSKSINMDPNLITNAARTLTLMEAVEITLQNQLDIQLSIEEIHFNEGILQESQGPFDPLLNAVETYTLKDNALDFSIPMKTHLTGHDSHIIASIRKKTRLGTVYTFDVDLERIYNPATSPFRRFEPRTLAFTINQPLLREFLYGSDAMLEKANQADLEAAYFDTLQVTSQQIFNTSAAYWDMVAAKKVRNILYNSIQRFMVLLRDTQKLVHQDQLAKGDLIQPLAQLASKKIDLQFAEQEYYRTYENLKLAMNIVDEIPCISEELFLTDDFPSFTFLEEKFNQIRCFLFERASQYRYDILANQKRMLAAEYLVLGARNETLPKLDVIGGVAYKNYTAGDRVAPGGNRKGPGENDWTIGINLSVPFYNDRAKGILRQQLARQSQLRIRFQQLIQSSLAQLREAVNNQVSLARSLQESNEVVRENRLLVSIETRKLKAGFSTLFFLIDFENRLTDALVQQVQIHKQFLQNIARIRFLSATLFKNEMCIDTISFESLTSLEFK